MITGNFNTLNTLRHSAYVFALLLLLVACRHKQKVLQPPPGKETAAKPKHHDTPPNSAVESKLGVTAREIKQNKLYAFVSEWYGTPYKYGGCKKDGVDCSCFTGILYEQVYGRKLGRTTDDMFKECKAISPEEAKEGDLFFFKINGNSISHVGVFLKNKLFVHASTSKGVIINSIEEAYYKKYLFSAGRVKKS